MKGILFKPEMIKAIIEGRKTQTRRVIKPQPQWQEPNHELEWRGYVGDPDCLIPYAHYQVGETVYIKEAWYAEKRFDHLKPREIPLLTLLGYPLRDIKPDWAGRIRSAMFLTQEFARYFITITDVRAERLQEISIEDLKAEGCQTFTSLGRTPDMGYARKFVALWNSINKDYPWESNPWVFRYEFEYKEGVNE